MDFKAFAFGTQLCSGSIKWKDKLECLDRHLRQVDIIRFDPSDLHSSCLLGLVELILKEARVLNRMLISARKVKADESNSAETPNPRKLLGVSRSILRHERAFENSLVVLYYD